MRPELTGIGGFILLALDIWALISVIGSNETTGKKVIWVIVILLLPLVGFIALADLRAARRAHLRPRHEALGLRRPAGSCSSSSTRPAGAAARRSASSPARWC